MYIFKKDNCIKISVGETEYVIIDENGQIQLKEMYKFLIDCNQKHITAEELIEFGDDIEEDIKNGLSIFIKDILSKSITDNLSNE